MILRKAEYKQDTLSKVFSRLLYARVFAAVGLYAKLFIEGSR